MPATNAGDGAHARRGAGRWLALVTVVLATCALVAASGGGAAGGSASDLTGTALQPDSIYQGFKSESARLAETDPALLGRSDDTPLNVMVKLDYDPVASYAGGIAGLPATSPSVTKKKLKENRGNVAAYEGYIAREEAKAVSGIQASVPGAAVRDSYRTAYGGLAMTVPANQIGALLSVDGVAAVQNDALEQPLTDVTPTFIGATQVWPALGGQSQAGKGVVVGVLDTGIWPESPSFADPGIPHPGGTFGCQFGDGSNPNLGAPFACNDKLVGAYAFTSTYLAAFPALPGEFCDNALKRCSPRDANGHGTHTTSTAAGSPVAHAPLYGIDRGPISGIAPGASVVMYRVCLDRGCFNSDAVAAVQQAILDGVDVINYSISGGVNAYTHPVELAFLDAYRAGILVNASAGNNGPGPATANHAGPWVNTVGASTSNRHFLSLLTLTASNGDKFTAVGATVTQGVETPTPLFIPPKANELCTMPLPPGSATGKVVLCKRGGNARVTKSKNAAAGGAAGMILANVIAQGLNTDNFFVPGIHIDGPDTALQAFLSSHSGITASWPAAKATAVQGDVMAPFSSRGPLGDFLKPDVTAPGVQILAGNTPVPVGADASKPGELFQAIQGTSMSSPHAAGAAALVRAAHPDWTPGQVKSALMTSAVGGVLKEDGATPSNPYDRGAGSVRVNRAVNPTATLDVPAADYIASAASPLGRVDLNLPSVNVPAFTGVITTKRTLVNVSGEEQPVRVSTESTGGTIDVSPKNPSLHPGEPTTITITIHGETLPDGQYFGQITLDPQKPGANDIVIPVAFTKRPGVVSLAHSCSPTTIARGASASCSVIAQNLAPVPAQASISVEGPGNGQLSIENVAAPGIATKNGLSWSGALSPAIAPQIVSLTSPGLAFGYVPLSLFGVPPVAGVGDDTLVNFSVPDYKFGAETYNRIAFTTNGYAVVGGGEAADLSARPQTFPNANRPNNVLAPLWTDLDLTPAQGGTLRVGTVSEPSPGGRSWLVADWGNAPVFGTTQRQSFELWIQLGTTESITYAYGTTTPPGATTGTNTGAENRDGTSGQNLGSFPASGSGLTVNTAGPTPGGSVTLAYNAFGRNAGEFDVLATLTSNLGTGGATKNVHVTVTK